MLIDLVYSNYIFFLQSIQYYDKYLYRWYMFPVLNFNDAHWTNVTDVIYTLPDHGLWFGESCPEMGRQVRLWTSDEGVRRKPGFYLQHGPHPRSWLRHQGINPSMVQRAPPVSVRYRFLWRSMSLHPGKLMSLRPGKLISPYSGKIMSLYSGKLMTLHQGKYVTTPR